MFTQLVFTKDGTTLIIDVYPEQLMLKNQKTGPMKSFPRGYTSAQVANIVCWTLNIRCGPTERDYCNILRAIEALSYMH